MRAINLKVLRDLWRMRAQALAIVMVTAVGTAAFVMLLGTLQSLEKTQGAYYERNRFADVFASVRRAPEALGQRIAQIPGVAKITTRIIHNVVLDVAGTSEPLNGLLVSAPRPEEGALNNLHLRVGRLVRPGSTDEVVLTEPFAEANKLKPGASFYATIKGKRRKLNVVGIGLSPEYIFFGVPGAMVPDDRRFGVLWMDRDALGAAFDLEGAFNDVVLSLMPYASSSQVISEVDKLLEPYGGIGAYARKDQISHATLNGNIEQLRSSIRIAAPIFLGVVAFLLHMLMMRHVETEREHIGVLKAFGYGDLEVAWHYMKMVLAIVAVGVAIGLFGGVWLGRAVTEIYAGNYHFPFLEYALTGSVLVQAAAIQMAAAVIGGFSSLRRAAQLPPAVAMRPPPPPVYRHTPIERLGLRLLPDQPSRMILRHIIRWPLRSLMTTLGIALATGVLVAPMAVLNSAMNMMDVHFFQAERQDLTVAFAQVRPERALMEMEHAPGVLQVETFRATLANIRFGNKQRRITILGRNPINELSRPLLPNLEPMEVPPYGVVISATLAEWLGARPGDYLDIHILESRRPKVRMPIVALAKSYVGMTFFMLHMDQRLLNRLMGDDDVITGVHMRVDPRRADALYDKLKTTPAITGAVSHTASFEAMQRIMAQTLRMTWFNIGFAGIIVFGVVYNNARISLAERSRELASMRMLGFTRFEVSYILLGELALLTMAAVPLGCALGYGLAWKLTEGTANEMFRLPLHVEKSSFGYAILAVLATVGLSAAAVVHRIFKLDLVSILKTRE